MLLTAAALLGRGHAVLRLNLRGAGRSRALCSGEYHAGRSEDLRDALGGLDPSLMAGGILLIGYSLGGNMVLKLLGEAGAGQALPIPVRAAVSVSAPIDLAEADRRMHDPRNRFYHDRMLARLRRNATRHGARLTPAERRAALSARTIFGFNDTFVAPRNGFTGARDYYAQASSLPFLPAIQVPTLIVHADNDPWIPAEAYRRFPWPSNPHLQPHILPGGGHVGFHMRGDRLPWYDRAMHGFFDALAGGIGPHP
jgi:predicted alpha/beta-fold hydrolase